MAALIRPSLALALVGLVAGCAGGSVRPRALDGKVLVRCAGPATRVVAVGSFNGWGPGITLKSLADGRFEAALALPPGPVVVACERHSANGAVVIEAPLNADRVVDDGFGGKNGVFDGLLADGGRR
jgi:hypothetical protein